MKNISGFNKFQTHDQREPEQKICAVHGEYVAAPIKLFNSVVAITDCPKCDAEKRVLRLKRERDEFARDALEMSGIPKKDQRPLSSFPACGALAVKRLSAWIGMHQSLNDEERQGAWVVLCGPNGTGKSGLAASVCYEMIQLGKNVKFMTLPELRSHVWNAHQRGSNHERAVYEVTRSSLLVIDDIGATKMKDAELELLSEVIDVRYRERLPMLLPMNLTKTDLEPLVGPRSSSRIMHRSAWISCNWTNLRVNKS